ncbi:hypothetical protein K9L27_04205 [Candidatus Gracilibacteria bacterium]|nr:hypothetical protein [Candidatus Gracilibacteria bacterium]
MQNPFKVSEWTVSKIVLILWIIFSILYIANSIRVNVINAVYLAGQKSGATETVIQLVDMAQKCQPIVLTAGEAKVGLNNPTCENKMTPPPTETPAQ